MVNYFTPDEYATLDDRLIHKFPRPIWSALLKQWRQQNPKRRKHRQREDQAVLEQQAHRAAQSVLDACRAELRTLGLTDLLHKLERGVREQARYEFIMRRCGGADILESYSGRQHSEEADAATTTPEAQAGAGTGKEASAAAAAAKKRLLPGSRRAPLVAAVVAATTEGSAPFPVSEADLNWALLFHKEAYLLNPDRGSASAHEDDHQQRQQQGGMEESSEQRQLRQQQQMRFLPQMGIFYKTGRVVPNPW